MSMACCPYADVCQCLNPTTRPEQDRFLRGADPVFFNSRVDSWHGNPYQ